MSRNKNLWLSSVKGLAVSIIAAICFLLIGFLFSLYFSGAAYPNNLQYAPEEWAKSFFYWFFWATLISFIFNFIVVIFSMYCGAFFRSSAAWIIYLFLAIITGTVFSVLFLSYNQEITFCSTISFILFMAEQIAEFVLSTVFCSKIWRSDFVPFL